MWYALVSSFLGIFAFIGTTWAQNFSAQQLLFSPEPLLYARIDPLVDPGENRVSGHVCAVVGASNFSSSATRADLLKSKCTTVQVGNNLDLSAYVLRQQSNVLSIDWRPVLVTGNPFSTMSARMEDSRLLTWHIRVFTGTSMPVNSNLARFRMILTWLSVIPVTWTGLAQTAKVWEMAFFTAILEIPIPFPKSTLQLSEHTLHSPTAGMGVPSPYKPKPNIPPLVIEELVPIAQKGITESQVWCSLYVSCWS